MSNDSESMTQNQSKEIIVNDTISYKNPDWHNAAVLHRLNKPDEMTPILRNMASAIKTEHYLLGTSSGEVAADLVAAIEFGLEALCEHISSYDDSPQSDQRAERVDEIAQKWKEEISSALREVFPDVKLPKDRTRGYGWD